MPAATLQSTARKAASNPGKNLTLPCIEKKAGICAVGGGQRRHLADQCRGLQAEGREGRRLAEEIRRQGPELDMPAATGALYCRRNVPTKLAGGVIIQGGNRVR